MADIDIIICFDASTIVQTAGSQDPNNPTQAPANSIFMVTRQSDVVSGQAGNELNVSANTGDNIRWREYSLSLDVDDRVMLYHFQGTANLIQQPQPVVITITDPVPGAPPAAPLPPANQQIQDFFWQTTVLNPGTDTYQFFFVVTRRDGSLIGYYMWDPFITITS